MSEKKEIEKRPYEDPILRCSNCSGIVHRAFIAQQGGCVHCGNKRFQNVRGLNDTELDGLKAGTLAIGVKSPYTIDKAWLDEWQPVEEVDTNG